MHKAEFIDLLFHSAMKRFFSIPAGKTPAGDITLSQMKVLWMIEYKEPLALSALARPLGISNAAASEIVNKLVKTGHVRREHSKKDRRQVALSLRTKGRAVIERFNRQRRERFQKLLKFVKHDDVERMVQALETLNEVLGKWQEV